ncbi:transcription factor bHLH52 [Cucurbita maxima]|uniref:Transcription factor bHLH52 n=1 Tax=Cucurbita maxima TaxID=3661 RepID=A0A6J1KJ69_CUCMA|nr:transcription factor bHLH52 [Cucurbita maxima]
MAALSFYSNFSSDPSSYHHQFHPFSPEISPELFHLPPPQLLPDPTFDYLPAAVDHSVFFPTATAPFFDDVSPFVFSDVYPYFPTPAVDEFVPVSAEFFPCDEFEFYCPKRQRVVMEQSFCYGGGGGNVGGEGGYFPLPEFFSDQWDGRLGNAEMMNKGDCLKGTPTLVPLPLPSPSPSSNNLSAQTIAARERRRKITAKTQELGELVPGGSKMNTAEMLSSAFKYVKFLQAQVAILQVKQETEQEQEQTETEDLQILESTMIQEKLYAEEKCLVPKGFVQNLANSSEIQSNPSILNSINQILHTNSS